MMRSHGLIAFTAALAVLPSWIDAQVPRAVILARAVDDPALSNEVLEQARAWIDAGISRVSTG